MARALTQRVRLAVIGLLTAGATGAVLTGPASAEDPPAGAAPTTAPAEPAIDVNSTEWADLERFMSAHSPRKWAMVRGKLRDRLAPSLLTRFRQLELIRVADAERYRLELTALHLEDEIYGLLRRLRAGDPVEDDLRSKVELLVDNRMSWRRERMNRSLRELKALNAREAADALAREMDRDVQSRDKQRDDRVERRMDELLKQAGKKGGRPGFPSRGLGGAVQPQTVPAE
jgi:hypothetical protein